MNVKEKIIQIWLTFVLTFIGFSKVVIIIPFIFQIGITNRYLVNFIDFVFKPADYISGLFTVAAAFSGPFILLTIFLAAIAKFILFAAEAYILATLIVILVGSEVMKYRLKDLFNQIMIRLGRRNKELDGYDTESKKKRIAKYFMPFVIGIVLIFTIGGYLVWQNITPKSTPIGVSGSGTFKKENEEKIRNEHDNQRILDILALSRALENYFSNNGRYPVSDGLEKISDDDSNSFKALQVSGYLKQSYKDPLSPKYYYGYKSDGKTYELTAVFENKKNAMCNLEGNLCIYRIRNARSGDCNYPDRISDFVLSNFSYSPKGSVSKDFSRVLISYATNDFKTTIYLTNFDDINSAGKYMEIVRKSSFNKDCEIANIKGSCGTYKIYSTAKRAYITQVKFTWQESNSFRVIEIEGGNPSSEDISDMEKKAKEYLLLFVSAFKNCKIENK